jgi:hypothetical protein
MDSGQGKLKIAIDGYLQNTYLDKEGGKSVKLQYSASEALKIAQIELMGRDLNNHLPVLLRTTYEISPKKTSYRKVNEKPKQKNFIRGRRTADS